MMLRTARSSARGPATRLRGWTVVSTSVIAFATLFATPWIQGCSSAGAGGPCAAGVSVSCACPTGAMGAQTCRPDGTFDACICAGGGAQTPDGGSGDPDGGSVGGSSSPDAPRFLSFGTSTSEITDGESATFTAVLTDPDGIEDLIGGSLTSPDGTVQYGPFATSAQEGSYAITLSWKQVSQARELAFEGAEEREFKATFFDTAGHDVWRTAKLRFTCPDAACGGSCTERLKDENNCGSCGKVCRQTKNGTEQRTMNPRCTQGKCIEFESSNSPTTGNAICSAVGATCVTGDCFPSGRGAATFYGDETSPYAYLSCSDVPSATASGRAFEVMTACCAR